MIDSAGTANREAAPSRRWVLVIVDDDDGVASLNSCATSRASLAAQVEGDVTCLELGDGDPLPEHAPDLVVCEAAPASWRTITMLSALRRRLPEEEVAVLVYSDLADELLPVHLTDFPGLRRISLGEDIVAATERLLRDTAVNPSLAT